MTKRTDKAIILAVFALAVAAFLLAGCTTTVPEGGNQFSDPSWIFARGQLDRQTALLERIAAAVEKQREVVTPNLGGPYYFQPSQQWTWPTNYFVWPTNGYIIVTNYCTLEGQSVP
jgi:predicted small secreted protein